MSANLEPSEINKLKNRISEVQDFISGHEVIYAGKLQLRSSQLSLRSWQHTLAELEAELAHTIWWESLSPSARIVWAEEGISEMSRLIKSGAVPIQYQVPTVLEIPLNDPRQLAWAQDLWASKIESYRTIITNETRHLLE